MPLPILIFLIFLLGAGAVVGGYAVVAYYAPGAIAARRLDRRLRDVSAPIEAATDDAALVMRPVEGPLRSVNRLVSRTAAGSRLAALIDQSGCRTAPSAIVLMTLTMAVAGGVAAGVFLRQWYAPPIAAGIAGLGPIGFLLNRRSARMRSFEEQFPEALDLLSRALRAGHAFQTSLGMVADELKPPVGPEFKKTFDQQNFGLPLRDALEQMTQRIPILDVRFFVTAVMIQRETGGNLSEILDNLAHVVRERFKIKRQVRVHTAHGRFTAFVLLALPAALALALSFLTPDHMQLLFREKMGQSMLIGAIVMQTIGFFWIRKVIKIEV
jgi:tight adherence protein B